MEIVPKIRPITFGLNLRTRGSEPSICFRGFSLFTTRRYSLSDISASGAGASIVALSADERQEVDGKFVSAFIRANKPR